MTSVELMVCIHRVSGMLQIIKLNIPESALGDAVRVAAGALCLLYSCSVRDCPARRGLVSERRSWVT